MPDERFETFWALVGDALVPGGRVVFVDDAYRAPEELVYGPESSVIMRRREGADGYRIQQHRVGLIARPHADLVTVGIHRHPVGAPASTSSHSSSYS